MGHFAPTKADPLAQDTPRCELQSLAEVVLELVDHPGVAIPPLFVDATATATSVYASSTVPGQTNSGVLSITGEPEPTTPIGLDELHRRGLVPELEGRAIDIILRCGWPRAEDPLGVKPCIPIPVDELKLYLEDIRSNGSFALKKTLAWLENHCRTQEQIRSLYVAAGAFGPRD